jgi:hypothetical protein
VRGRRPRGAIAIALIAAGAVALAAGAAEMLQPDISYREAQLELRVAQRDTAGRGEDAARLDTLGVALLRLARVDDATRIFRRVLDTHPDDPTAQAALGKLALFADRLGEADSLLSLAVARDRERGWVADLYAVKVRRGEYAAAAQLAEELGDHGRAEMLNVLAATTPIRLAAGPAEARIPWVRKYPVPLVKVKINGQSMLMGLDVGARDLLIDPAVVRRAGVQTFPAQSLVSWLGTRVAAANALVTRLEIGPMRIEEVPASVVSLRKWSLSVNPQSDQVMGVIGLSVLRQFHPTFDYPGAVLVLRRPGEPIVPVADSRTVPFEMWGENDITVWGHIAAGRRMAMTVQTGIPECGVAAPAGVFQELGLKAGGVTKLMSKAGSWLGGPSWAKVGVPTITVGPVTSGKVDGWSGAMDDADLWRHGVRRDALLGNDFMRHSRVTFDWANRRMIFEPK